MTFSNYLFLFPTSLAISEFKANLVLLNNFQSSLGGKNTGIKLRDEEQEYQMMGNAGISGCLGIYYQ